MKLAYLILLHDHPGQFQWLWRAIYNTDDIFLVHIDKKTSVKKREIFERILGKSNNIYILPSRQVEWGAWSLAQVEIDAIEFFCCKSESWKYFINLSGFDYPLRRREEIVAELQKGEGENFVSYQLLKNLHCNIQERVRWRHELKNGYLIRTSEPINPPEDFRLEWKGSNWHILSRDFCEWLVCNKLFNKICEHLKQVAIPDEFLMQTAIMNSPFQSRVSDNKRTILWPGPKILTANDANTLITSTGFFARKFDFTVDDSILILLAQRINAQTP